MIKLSFYAKLLTESIVNSEYLQRQFESAIRVIFNIDSADILPHDRKSKQINPPIYAHSYNTTNIVFRYKDQPILMTIHMYHFKINPIELKSLSDGDIRTAVQNVPNVNTTDDLLKSNNPLIKINAILSFYHDRETSSHVDHNKLNIGKVTGNNIADVVKKAKSLLDESSDGGNGGDEFQPFGPISPNAKTVATV